MSGQHARRVIAVEQCRAAAIAACEADSWVSTSQPSSSSIGDPQIPIWTNSHTYCGRKTASPPLQMLRSSERMRKTDSSSLTRGSGSRHFGCYESTRSSGIS